jgi:hypothetical protein
MRHAAALGPTLGPVISVSGDCQEIRLSLVEVYSFDTMRVDELELTVV